MDHAGDRSLSCDGQDSVISGVYKARMQALFITSTRLGDAILSTGILARLLADGCRVTVACGPVAAPLFDGVPGVERVIVLRKGRFGAHWRKLWLEAVGRRWDRVVDLRGSAFAWTVRAGSRRVFRAPKGGAGHRVEQLRAGLGWPDLPEPRLWISETDREQAANILYGRAGPLLALCPTANWPPKAWPADRFVELMRAILPEARVIVAGGPGERDLALPVLDAIPPERRIDLVGTAPLMTLAACLARADLVVANDSGLMHLAAASGAPTLGLFGPSRESHYAPRGPRTAWVRADETADDLLARSDAAHGEPGVLMTGLPVQRVAEAARALLAEG